MILTKLQKEYIELHGWVKKKGTLIDLDAIDTSYESFFVPHDCKTDYLKEDKFWCDESCNDEGIYDDFDIIDHIEDYAEFSFEEFKKRRNLKDRSKDD
ncbi:hypothetical protein LCGC14_0970210 [marine sediment metagenome]|uniref:Uncharacterized protein n=1 Tax=marine sediment metagenome TaxID=412755 RepID=A0A0F9RIA5_9ZZZZ